MTDVVIDELTFSQLLEIDDYEFARGIIEEFFEQAEGLLVTFENLMRAKDWDAVGKLGHHLKGSSAAVGASAVRDICDKIQHYAKVTKNQDPEAYLRQTVDDLIKAVPIAKQALNERLRAAASD